MKMTLDSGIPFVDIIIKHNDKILNIPNVLVDTGSASTIISTDIALELGLKPSLADIIHRVRG